MNDNTREEYTRAQLTVTEFSEKDVIATSELATEEYEINPLR